MKNILNPFIVVPMLIAPAEMLMMIYLSRKRIKERFARIARSYIFCVAVCLVFGYVFLDQTGFSFVPVLVIVNPWAFVVNRLSISSLYRPDVVGNFPYVLFGTLLNCVLFYIIGKVSYPKRSSELIDEQAT